LQKLFQLQEELYQAGARNFLFIDVPPIHRSPAGESKRSLLQRLSSHNSPQVAEHRASSPNITMSYDNWNAHLHCSARKFNDNHPDATILMFSAWDVFNKVLDDPEAFGFSHDDRRKYAGKIWVDHLHPSSRMHEIIAKDIECFLSEFPSQSQSQSQ
jgi:phospholipase/lecithinase/hemolysin